MQLIQYKQLFQIHFHFQWTDSIPMFPGSSRTWQYQYINIDININIETNININISGSSGTWQTLLQQRSAPEAPAPRCRSPSVCWKRKTRLVSQKEFFFHGRWIDNCWDFFLAKRVYVQTGDPEAMSERLWMIECLRPQYGGSCLSYSDADSLSDKSIVLPS